MEQVWIENPLPGGYSIHIGGTLDEGYESQDYTFLLSMSPANQWAPSGDGSYNESANWTNNRVPGGVNALANFVGSITAASTVTVDSPVTVGTINFESGDYAYTIAGPASITLQTSTGDAQINVLAGNHSISAPLTFAAGLTVDAADGTGVALEPASGYCVLEGNLTKAGSGLLVLGSSLLVVGELNLNGGEVDAAANVLALEGGNVNLADETTLKAAGTINRRVLGDPGSTLELTGTTQIGLSSETDGYAFGGKLVVGAYAVGLMDANLAELRGASIAGGSISSLNGIHLLPVVMGDPNSYIKGYGTINGNVVAGTDMPDPDPDLPARIWASGGVLEFTGILSGAWTPIGTLKISGLARPGFSAYLGKAGAPSTLGQMEFEIYGNVGQHDKLPPGILNNLNLPLADQEHGYDQYLVYGDAPPELGGSGERVIEVFGPFSAVFRRGYLPQANDEFRLIFAHEFDPFDGEFGREGILPAGILAYTPEFLAGLEAFIDSLPAPSERGWVWEADPRKDAFTIRVVYQAGTAAFGVVPEPGTLALLLSGGLGLLALACSRLRRR